jgi:outer membrane protein assembly factor BamB
MKRSFAAFVGLSLLFSGGFLLLATGSPFRHARAEDGQVRRWTDATGKFNVQAALVEVKDGKAILAREGGENLSVPLTQLSREDQKYVREELARRRTARTEESLVSRRDGAASSSSSSDDWPQWRGPRRDGVSLSKGLLDQWPKSGPPLVWQTRGLGNGWSSVAVTAGKIYTLGNRDGVKLFCLDANQGRELWAVPMDGGSDPTGTPTVDGDLVFAESNDGDLLCADAQSGKEVWRKNLNRDFGAGRPSWGFSESPLVDGDRVIVTPGSDRHFLVALNKRTGEVDWSCPRPDDVRGGHGGAGYSSPVISNGGGVKQYVQLTGNGVIGVRAEDGKFLWSYGDVANGTANIPTPIVSGDFVFCSSGYDTGSALLKITGRGDEATAQEVYFLDARTFQNHHGGMVLVDGFVYAGHGHNNGFPICVEMASGKVVWGGQMRGPGSGSAAVTYADGDLIFRYQDGKIALIEANPRQYRLKSEFTPVHQDRESWAHPVVADGKLYLREQDVLMCYNLRK